MAVITADINCPSKAGLDLNATRSMKVKLKSDVRWGDRVFRRLMMLAAVSLLFLTLAFAIFLGMAGWESLARSGLAFFVNSQWDPVQEDFGALAVVYGTVVSSMLAIMLATPVGIGVALFTTDIASKPVARIVGFFVEMLAAIPSVVFGLFGVFVLVPFLRTWIEPPLIEWLGWFPLFAGPPFGVGMLAAGVILAIMILPTISSICREVFRAVDQSQREAALALGATRWEMMFVAVLRGTRTGTWGAIILALGRALGETMAVTMVIGNRTEIVTSLFAPAQTMASVIANEYAEATSDIHLSALAAVGLTLFGVTIIVNGLAKFLIWQVTRERVR